MAKVRIKREYIGLTRCLRAFKLGLYNIGVKTRNFFAFDLKTIARLVRSRHLTLFRKEIKHSTYPTLISKEPFSQFGILPITFSFLISRIALRPKGTRILKAQLSSSVKPEWWTVPFGALYSDGGHLAKEARRTLNTNISEGRKKIAYIAVFISRKLKIVMMKRIASPANILLDWAERRGGGGGEFICACA